MLGIMGLAPACVDRNLGDEGRSLVSHPPGDRNITVHDVICSVLAGIIVIGGAIGQAFFPHVPWIGMLVKGPRLLLFIVLGIGILWRLERWLVRTRVYRESRFMRELGRGRQGGSS